MPPPSLNLVDPGWAATLEPVAESIAHLGEFLVAEEEAGRGYLPEASNVLRAFRYPLAEVRVLIVGQDPYPTPGPGPAGRISPMRGHESSHA